MPELIVPGVRGEQVTFIAYRFDTIWLSRIIEKLFTQPRDGDIDATVHTILADAAQIF